MRPQLCLRCYRTFQSERSLAEHQNETERCAQVLNIPEIEGITPEQETQLKSKKRIKGEDSEERKWECVYLILFPGETEIPSPCKLRFLLYICGTLPQTFLSLRPALALVNCHGVKIAEH